MRKQGADQLRFSHVAAHLKEIQQVSQLKHSIFCDTDFSAPIKLHSYRIATDGMPRSSPLFSPM